MTIVKDTRIIIMIYSGFLFQYCIIAQSKWFCCLVYNIYQATVSTQKFSSNDYMMRRLHVIQV